MKPFDARHLFGFLRDFDTVADQYQPAVDGHREAAFEHDLPPVTHDGGKVPGLGSENKSIVVYSLGRNPSQRTKELAPH